MARSAIPCAVIFMVGCALAQAPSNEITPTFSAGTKLVQVDVVARSKGAPATGLKKEDFTVLDNGKSQKISFFSVRSARGSGSASVPLPAGAVSNRTERDDESLASATILLIDQKNTPHANQAFAIQRVVKFLSTRRKRDRLGVYTFGKDGKLQIVQDLTDDAELLTRAANNLKAQDPSYRSSDTEGMTDRAATEFIELSIRERAMETKQVLEAVAHHMAIVPGRKSLIWVSVGFPLMWPPPPGPPDIDFNPDVEQTARLLNDASVALYAVDARGLLGALNGATGIPDAEHAGPRQPVPPGLVARPMRQGRDGYPAGLDTMAKLSGLTGGLLYTNDNGIEDLIREAMDDGELTYTLGFYPLQEAREDWHSLKVEVDKPGVNLRYRENYFAARMVAAPAAAPPAANDRSKLDALLKDPLDATQLRLTAETKPDPAKPGFWQVHVTVDLHDVHLENQDNIWVGGVDVSLLIEGSRTLRTMNATVKIPDAKLAATLEKGITMNDSLDGNGLTGKLRIVALDRATGAAGSIRVPLR